MNKFVLFLAAIAMLLSSCGEKDAFTINGKLPSADFDGQNVYLMTLDSAWSANPNTRVGIDTASVIDGQFVFKGIAKEGPMIHYLVLDDAPESWRNSVAVIIEPGQINVTLDSVPTVGGTPLNDSQQVFDTKMNALNADIMAIWQKMKDTTNVDNVALTAEFEAKQKESTQAFFDFTKANMQTQIGTFNLVNYSHAFDAAQLKELLPLVKPEYRTQVKDFDEKVKKLEARVQALDNTAVGKPFTDIKGKTPEGKDIALSEFAGKGKYVLIDFWASWCGPCREETPKLVEAYKLYKDKGFEIVGFSLDREGQNDKWIAGIKALNITWPQISELAWWDSKAVADYGVSSIPHLVLLDKDGTIMDRGFGGDELLVKLAELLK